APGGEEGRRHVALDQEIDQGLVEAGRAAHGAEVEGEGEGVAAGGSGLQHRCLCHFGACGGSRIPSGGARARRVRAPRPAGRGRGRACLRGREGERQAQRERPAKGLAAAPGGSPSNGRSSAAVSTPRFAVAQSTSRTSSISTETSNGSSAMPPVARTWSPAS